MKLYVFQAVSLPIIRSLFTVHSAQVYVILVWRQLSRRTRSCSNAVFKPVWHIPVPSVQWINSWWWVLKLPEICRVSCWSISEKLVHLVGFILNPSVGLLFLLTCEQIRMSSIPLCQSHDILNESGLCFQLSNVKLKWTYKKDRKCANGITVRCVQMCASWCQHSFSWTHSNKPPYLFWKMMFQHFSL